VLKANNMVLCYTDGITETLSEEGEWYGEDRLNTIFKNNNGGSSKATNDSLLQSIKEFKGNMEDHDDFALLTLCFQ
jgi:serine phosphatase RsbU (regulator of sigma subunit)